MNKKLYTRNYEVKLITLPDGSVREEVIYKGDYYCPQWTPRQKRKTKIVCSALIVCSAISFVLVGLLNTAGSRQYYVLLPFLFTSFPLVFEIFAIFRLWSAPDKMPIDVYHNSLLRMKKSSAAAALIAAVGVVGEVVFLASDPANFAADELKFLCGVLLIFAANTGLYLVSRGIRCTVSTGTDEIIKKK